MNAREINSSPQAWAPYRPTGEAPWDLKRVVHLHRRAGFAATWREIQRDLAGDWESAVTRIIGGKARLDFLPDSFDSLAEEIGDAAVVASSPERLKAWWVYRMLFSPDPLAERLTLMWHNHFATSNFKVGDVQIMRRQNEVFRAHGRGSFRKLLSAVLHDPAVLVWLDAPSNRKGRPNENLSRELMELFTLGVGHFDETDVKEAARALTGWHVRDGEFTKRPEWHDDGKKTILGRRGNWDGDDLIAILCDHPATARRLAWRLCDTFMGEAVADEAAIDDLAAGLRAHDLDIGWGVASVLRSNLFFADQNIGTCVAGPVEFCLGAVRALGLLEQPPSTLVLAEWIKRMGLELFYPPNVGGWPGGREWLTTRTIVARANFAAALVRGELGASGAAPDFWPAVKKAIPDAGLERAVSFYNDLLLGGRLRGAQVQELLAKVGAAGQANAALSGAVELLLGRPEAQLM